MGHTASLLSCDVVSVPPGETILGACRLMRDKRVGCVAVVEGGRLVGIFTERDLLNRVVPAGAPPETSLVSAFMTRDPVSVEADAPIETVFSLLAERRFRHVPIVARGKPVGMVSLSDFAGILAEVFAEDAFLRYFVDYCERRPAAR